MAGSAVVAVREVKQLALDIREPASRGDAAEPMRHFAIMGIAVSMVCLRLLRGFPQIDRLPTDSGPNSIAFAQGRF
jgi:hypothetical protein